MRNRTVLMLGATLLLSGPAAAWGEVTIRIPASQGVVGTVTRVAIAVERAADLGVIEATLTYDPGLLEFVALEAGQLNTGLVESNLVRPGELRIGCVAEPPLSGDGELFVVSMKVLGAGTATLGWDRIKLKAGSSGIEIPAVAQAGTFTAQGAGGPPPLPPGPPPPGPPPAGPIPRSEVPLAVVVLLGCLLAGSLALAIGIIVLVRRKNPGR